MHMYRAMLRDTSSAENSATARSECYTFDYPNESGKPQMGRKNSTDHAKIREGSYFSKMKKKSIAILCFFFLVAVCGILYLIYWWSSLDPTEIQSTPPRRTFHALFNDQSYSAQICSSPLCRRSAENLKASMYTEKKPCDDFYEFACGNWPVYHDIQEYQLSTDWFDTQQDLLLANISRFLNQIDLPDEPGPVHEARKFYRSCILQGKTKDYNFTATKIILEKVNLPRHPFKKFDGFSWFNTTVLSKGILDQDFFISFSISSDPQNRTINKMHISKPSGNSPLPTHRKSEQILRLKIKEILKQNEDKSTEMFDGDEPISQDYNETFIQYIRNMSRYVIENNDEKWSDFEEKFKDLAYKVLSFHVQIEKLTDLYYVNESLIPTYITIRDLQSRIDQISNAANSNKPVINWLNYFEELYKNANLSLDVNDDTVVLITDEEYFNQMFSYLSFTLSTAPEVVKYYMWMTIVATVGPYTNEAISTFKEEFVRLLTDTRQRPRELYCADVVNQKLGMATAYSVANDPFMKHKIQKIEIMVSDIMEAFVENIKAIEWMDEKTKKVTERKIHAMKNYTGFPNWLTERGALEEYYDNFSVSENDFLGNILKKIQSDHVETLKLYDDFNDFSQESWISNPLDVNAYNYMEGNSITIPAGILQFPFYGQGLEALNYGAIGSIIGHEITHSFDNTGKEYDDYGNRNPWWTNKTKTEFENRTHCFVKYYESYDVPGSNGNIKVNGEKTLDENIADNGGLGIAYKAYKKYVEKNGKELKLTEFDEYSSEQLLFLGFASTWCEHSSAYSAQQSITDNHSPNKIRVLGTLANSEEFVQAWKCPAGSAMNRQSERCKMW